MLFFWLRDQGLGGGGSGGGIMCRQGIHICGGVVVPRQGQPGGVSIGCGVFVLFCGVSRLRRVDQDV